MKMIQVKSNKLIVLLTGAIWLLMGPRIWAEDTLAVNAFVDAQVFGGTEAINEGFSINDGAVYFNHETGDTEFKIDLPFRANLMNNSSAAASALGPKLFLGETKAQAYIGHKFGNSGFKWKLGQFDSIFGFEQNDATDITFSRQGILYNQALPLVHAGWLGSYRITKMLTLHLLAANLHDQGVARGQKLDTGIQLAYSPSVFRIALGYLMNHDTTLKEWLFDTMLGASIGPIAADFEIVVKQLPGAGSAGTSVLGNLIYSFSETFSAGFRAEFANKTRIDGFGSNDTKQMLITFGPQYSISKNLKLKLDGSFWNYKDSAGTTTDVNMFALAAVYKI